MAKGTCSRYKSVLFIRYRRINDKETIGLELRYFSLGDITFTDINGTELGQYKPNEFAIGPLMPEKAS